MPGLSRAGRLAVGLGGGLIAMVLALWLAGASPGSVLVSIVSSTLTRPAQQADALIQGIPILLIALGTSMCFRAKFWNIGGEAYFYAGAVVSLAIGLKLPALPGPVAFALMAVSAAAVGALLSGIAGLLRVYRNINEVVVTLMMNLAMIQIVAYAVRAPLRDPESRLAFSALLPQHAWLPSAHLPGLPRVHSGLYFAIVAAVLMYYLLVQSSFGHRVTVTGANRDAARATGIDVSRTILVTSLGLGMLGGLAGMIFVAGVTHRVYVGLSPGIGFGYIAIMVALLAGLHPLWVLASTAFYTILSGASDTLQVQFGLHRGFINMFFLVVLLSVLASEALFLRRKGHPL